MNSEELISELSKYIEPSLASDVVYHFLDIRKDCKTGTLGGSAAGKFVESVVQILQFLENKIYDRTPNVDSFLKSLESRPTCLNDDLKLCCARIARSMYTLRNKRNIAHKNSVDPNVYDLKYLYECSQWILSEIVRQVMTSNMTLAGKIVELIHIPISSCIEQLGDRKLVHRKLSVNQELLVLLYSYYPDLIPREKIGLDLDRRSKSAVSNSLKGLWKQKLIHRESATYKLTQEGFREATRILQTAS